MDLVERVLGTLLEGEIRRIVVGARWTAVAAETDAGLRCGLAATLDRQAGGLRRAGAAELERWASRGPRTLAASLRSGAGLEASVAAAAVNAFLPRIESGADDQPAEEIVAECGADKDVVLVGRFAFAPRLAPRVRRLRILEREPHAGELPASEAPRVLADAEFVAITGMAFVNGSLENLLGWCGAQAEVLVLGPSTPLSPILFDFGVDWLAGAEVESIDAVLEAAASGGDFHRLRQAGVRRACLRRVHQGMVPGWEQ